MRSATPRPPIAVLVTSDAALMRLVEAALSELGLTVLSTSSTEDFAAEVCREEVHLALVDVREDMLSASLAAVRAQASVACLLFVPSGDPLDFDIHSETVVPLMCNVEKLRMLARVASRTRRREVREREIVARWATSTSDAIVIVDPEARIVMWNQGAEAVFGRPREGMIGEPMGVLLPTRYSDRRRLQTQNALCSSDATMGVGEVVMQHADGRELPIEYSASTIQFGEFTYSGFRLHDLTERAKSEDELMKLASFPEFDPVPNIEMDRSGVISYMNPAAEMLLEKAPESLALQGLPELLEGRDPSKGAYFVREVDDGGVFYEQHVHYIAPWDSLRVYTLDISERKRAEQELRRTLDSLELRVIERTVELEREVEERKYAEKSAYEASRAKSVFLANMSHELRTPLNVIIGFSELLIEDAESEPVIDDLNKVLGSAHHLLGLISELLDLSKIEAGKMTVVMSEIRLVGFLKTLAISGKALAVANGNRFEVDFPPDLGVISSDELRLRQVLLNLISNAAKFTENGLVKLTVRRIEDPPGLAMSVDDTGIGLSEEQLAKIFKPFIQADESIARRFGGTGLGLTICKELCALLGATITAKSTLSQGTSFTVILPGLDTPNEALSEDAEARMRSAEGVLARADVGAAKGR